MYIVNGKEVDYLYITKNKNGDKVVEYSEQFNIFTAHISESMKRLRDNDLLLK